MLDILLLSTFVPGCDDACVFCWTTPCLFNFCVSFLAQDLVSRSYVSVACLRTVLQKYQGLFVPLGRHQIVCFQGDSSSCFWKVCFLLVTAQPASQSDSPTQSPRLQRAYTVWNGSPPHPKKKRGQKKRPQTREASSVDTDQYPPSDLSRVFPSSVAGLVCVKMFGFSGL